MSGLTSTGGSLELTESGGRALKLQTDTPHLVSMGGDRLSTSVTLHPIPQGRVTLGSGAGVDIPVQGTGVLPLHCHIENSEGVVTLYPLSENLSIDGLKVCGPTRLSQGVMLTIGRSNYMRFNHPTEAKLMKSVLPNPRISMAPITFEPQPDNQQIISPNQLKFIKKPPVAPKKSPRESMSDSGGDGDDPPANNIMMKVSKFEFLAAQNFRKSISPKVFSSNSVTVNTPAKDVLGKAPPDLQHFTKHLPQSALNYSDYNNYNEKQQVKLAERPIFGRKSPQYVNVTVNETKNINNRVIIYENGCIPKNHVNIDHNEFNGSKSSTNNKNINVSRVLTPSPSYNRNPSPLFRSLTPGSLGGSVGGGGGDSNNSSTSIIDKHRSGSLGELTNSSYSEGSLEDMTQRSNDAELRRSQAQKERIEEQQIEKAEQQRLEEILNMCAEYEKQVQCEKNSKPIPNRIKTNGSLPRDKRQYSPSSPGYGGSTPPSSPRDVDFYQNSNQRNYSFDNVSPIIRYSTPRENHTNTFYENVDINQDYQHNRGGGSVEVVKTIECGSPYENISIQQPPSNSSNNNTPLLSPRTKIKTFLSSTKKDSLPKDSSDFPENQCSDIQDQYSPQQIFNKQPEISDENNIDLTQRKQSPIKFILPLDDNHEIIDRKIPNLTTTTTTNNNMYFNFDENNMKYFNGDKKSSHKNDEDDVTTATIKSETLLGEKKSVLALISKLKRQLNEIEIHEEELHRELDMEKALIAGEYKSKLFDLDKLENRKQKMMKRAQRIEESMCDCQMKQEQDQKECRLKLKQAQDFMTNAETNLTAITKTDPDYERVFDQYLKAQEILDNERKVFEDLEFHHLEEEADWLASREELQREIIDLSKRIDNVREQIVDLERQKQQTAKSDVSEFQLIEKQRVACLVRVEELRLKLKSIDSELSMYSNHQESEQELSSDDSDDSSDDKSKDLDKQLSNLSLTMSTVQDMSCSFIVSNSKVHSDDTYNMSQSFNEKLLQEKSILEAGITKRYPSQDDIDRISKVTTNAPINIDQGRGSLGRKTIESLKDIERQRHLHLCQQGSQVIEQERQRVLALKQRVQEEVRSEWAQRSQDCSSLTSIGSSDDKENDGTIAINEQKSEAKPSTPAVQDRIEVLRLSSEEPESPRPVSEISELSVETGGTFGRKRIKVLADKQRPLTRYLPIRGSDLDLRQHIESAGHQVVLCPHVIINSSSCRGFLHKKGSKLNGWSKRWFVFDRLKHTFTYYAEKSEKKPRGGAYFQAIEEVYLDHLNTIKSPNPQLTFIVKTRERFYYLMAPSPEAMRIWVDVIFTGAEGYQEFVNGT